MLRYKQNQFYDAHRDYWDPSEFPYEDRKAPQGPKQVLLPSNSRLLIGSMSFVVANHFKLMKKDEKGTSDATASTF